jgi:hypothetical protein
MTFCSSFFGSLTRSTRFAASTRLNVPKGSR